MFRLRTERISFEEAEQFIQGGQLEKLGRSLEQEEYYARQMKSLKKEWHSISDFILCDKFALDYEVQDGRKKASRPLPNIPRDQRLVVRTNDHPYYFTDDVMHFVLWKFGEEMVSHEDIESAIREISSELEKRSVVLNRWIHFQNPPRLMSIPEVHHAHILIKR